MEEGPAPPVAGTRRRVCEKLVLDNPETFLSKTPEEIEAVTRSLQQGERDLGETVLRSTSAALIPASRLPSQASS